MTDSPFRTPRTAAAVAALTLLVSLTAGGAAAQTTQSTDSAPAARKPAARTAPARKAPPKPAPKRSTKPAAKPAAPAATDAAPPAAAPAATPALRLPAPRAAAPTGPREADYIVAVVNSEPITNTEVRTRIARAQRALDERGAPQPPSDALRQEVLDRLIAERAQLQYARELKLTVDQGAMDQAELAIARQNQLPSVAALHQRLSQEGIALKDFREDLRNQVLLARLREREIEPRINVTDAEVDAYIREQTGNQASSGQELNLAMILVAVPESATAAEVTRLQARAAEAARRARAGEDFTKLATEYSDANNRGADGGVLGLRPADRYPGLFVEATTRVPVNGIAGPVKSDAGFHVLKVLERKRTSGLPDVMIPQTHVRHILLRPGTGQSESVARERLADARRRIQSRAITFEEAARQLSQDASAKDGGDLGWATPGQFVPEFEQAMNNLEPGQVSEPVPSRFGLHLIQVVERREQALTAAEQRAMAKNVLREKKAEEAFDTWSKEVRGRAYVEQREPPR